MLFAHAFADAQRREGIEPADLKILSIAMIYPDASVDESRGVAARVIQRTMEHVHEHLVVASVLGHVGALKLKALVPKVVASDAEPFEWRRKARASHCSFSPLPHPFKDWVDDRLELLLPNPTLGLLRWHVARVHPDPEPCNHLLLKIVIHKIHAVLVPSVPGFHGHADVQYVILRAVAFVNAAASSRRPAQRPSVQFALQGVQRQATDVGSAAHGLESLKDFDYTSRSHTKGHDGKVDIVREQGYPNFRHAPQSQASSRGTRRARAASWQTTCPSTPTTTPRPTPSTDQNNTHSKEIRGILMREIAGDPFAVKTL